MSDPMRRGLEPRLRRTQDFLTGGSSPHRRQRTGNPQNRAWGVVAGRALASILGAGVIPYVGRHDTAAGVAQRRVLVQTSGEAAPVR